MNIEYTGRNYTIDDRVRELVSEKLQKLEKLLDEPIDARITLSAEKRKFVADLHLHHRHGSIQAEESSDDNMFEAIGDVVAKAERQAERDKTRRVDRRRREASANHWPVDVLAAGTLADDAGPRVIKSSRLEIKPMTLEEAAMKLGASRSEFVVFLDAANERVSVLYKRKDHNFGLIAPEF
ncbi:MAG TPA: ribosome-associated translation inhibitor RaiA [Thermoanaerobaculia bacterium]|jgi:putative sigma-54 modulation protein|nr:ribosome-associated translation inhibitor RaiA [Thermoanaerobaculia bacterium]